MHRSAKDPDLYFLKFPLNVWIEIRKLYKQWLHDTGRGGAWKPTKHSDSDSDSDIIYFVPKIQYSQQVVNLTQIHEWVKETPIKTAKQSLP